MEGCATGGVVSWGCGEADVAIGGKGVKWIFAEPAELGEVRKVGGRIGEGGSEGSSLMPRSWVLDLLDWRECSSRAVKLLCCREWRPLGAFSRMIV